MLFRCLRSGNTVNIEQQDDIDRMKFHEGYEAVSTHSQGESHGLQENANAEDAATDSGQDAKTEVKKRGRPAKKR